MSSTAFDAIEDAIVALLVAAPAVSEQIETDEARVLATQFADGVIVRIKETDLEPASIMGGPLMATTTMEVEVRKHGPAGQSAAKALGPLLALVNARIAADPTLAGLTMDVSLNSVLWDSAPGEVTAHSALATWTVLHQINSNTLA